jgi:undecaprenyl-diphosphatase
MEAGLPQPIRKRLNPVQRYGVRLVLVALTIVLVAVPFAFLVFQVLSHGPLTHWDISIANRLNNAVYRHHGWVVGLKFISNLGKPITLAVLVVVATAYVLWRGRRRLAIFLVVAALGGGLVDSAVKAVVNRPRPHVDHLLVHAMGKSFPSGHAMSSTVSYGALLVAFLPVVPRAARRVVLGAVVLLLFAIGVSRLALGVHYVSDVIAGWVLGLAWLAGSTAAFEAWRSDRGRKPSEPLAEGVEPEAAKDLKVG